MKVSELEGAALDYWVAKAEGWTHRGAIGEPYDANRKSEQYRFCLSGANDWWDSPEGHWVCGPCEGVPYRYSTEWERGGPIIERERISIVRLGDYWYAMHRENVRLADCNIDAHDHEFDASDTAPLIAAMRCYVASKFGKEVP